MLSDFLTSETATTEAGIINTGISLLAIATTTYLALKIEAERAAAFEARSQLAHVGRVTTLGELTASIAHEVNQPLAATVINGCHRVMHKMKAGKAAICARRFGMNRRYTEKA